MKETKALFLLAFITAVVFIVGILFGCGSLEQAPQKAELLVWGQYQLVQIEMEKIVLDPTTDPDLRKRLQEIDRIAVRTLDQFSAGIQSYDSATAIVLQAIETYRFIKPKTEPEPITFYIPSDPIPMPYEPPMLGPYVYPDVVIVGTGEYHWKGEEPWILQQ